MRRRSTTDPVLFSRNESMGDEDIPQVLKNIEVDQTGAGTELNRHNRPSIMHQTDASGEYAGSNEKYKVQTNTTFWCCSSRDSSTIFPSPPPLEDEAVVELMIASEKICLVLDLDETLVHSSFTQPVKHLY